MAFLKNISIRNKLITIQALTALVALLICCALFVFLGLSTFKASAIRKMYSVARITGESSIAPLRFVDQDGAHKVLTILNREPDIREAVLLDKKGGVFATSHNTPRNGVQKVTLPRIVWQHDGPQLYAEIVGRRLIVAYHIFDNREYLGTVVINSELLYLRQIIKTYLLIAALVFAAGLLAALVISYFLQQMISKRLLVLVSKTREVADTGDYSLRVESQDKDEIGYLSREINSLLHQIEEMKRSLLEANSELEQRVQLRTAELEAANKELESFSYTVSHDLKAPLRAINGFTDILVKKYADQIDDKGKEIANVIVLNARKMGQLIQDLLEFSRIGRKELAMDTVSMEEIVQQVVSEVKAANPGRDITVNIGPLPPAHGDKNLLTQVWVNFISNAFKYTGHKEKAEITIGAEQKDGENIYYIKDNGAGFDMKYSDKLFRVFQRLHGAEEFEGTGVGLAIVSRIITRHGGRVWAEGKPDEGAIFYFSLPA